MIIDFAAPSLVMLENARHCARLCGRLLSWSYDHLLYIYSLCHRESVVVLVMLKEVYHGSSAIFRYHMVDDLDWDLDIR